MPVVHVLWLLSRRHVGASGQDSCLDVSDINSYMARFRPGPRNSGQYKGHPQGPRVPSPIRPRSNPATMDNSLRKFDIEGTRSRRWLRGKGGGGSSGAELGRFWLSAQVLLAQLKKAKPRHSRHRHWGGGERLMRLLTCSGRAYETLG